eukprot:903981_1
MIETLEVPNTALELNTSGSKSEHNKSTKKKIKSRTISAHNILLPDPSAPVLESNNINHLRHTVCTDTNIHQHLNGKSKSYDDAKTEAGITITLNNDTSECVEESVNDSFDVNDEIMITLNIPKNVSSSRSTKRKLHLRRTSLSNPIGLKKGSNKDVMCDDSASEEDVLDRLSPVVLTDNAKDIPSLNPSIKSKSKSTMLNPMLNAMNSFSKRVGLNRNSRRIEDRNRLIDHSGDLPKMDQMMVSLNVLAKSGFYSMRKSANSIQPLAEIHNEQPPMRKFKSDVNVVVPSNKNNNIIQCKRKNHDKLCFISVSFFVIYILCTYVNPTNPTTNPNATPSNEPSFKSFLLVRNLMFIVNVV